VRLCLRSGEDGDDASFGQSVNANGVKLWGRHMTVEAVMVQATVLMLEEREKQRNISI
jgi:hypothetical protein